MWSNNVHKNETKWIKPVLDCVKTKVRETNE